MNSHSQPDTHNVKLETYVNGGKWDFSSVDPTDQLLWSSNLRFISAIGSGGRHRWWGIFLFPGGPFSSVDPTNQLLILQCFISAVASVDPTHIHDFDLGQTLPDAHGFATSAMLPLLIFALVWINGFKLKYNS